MKDLDSKARAIQEAASDLGWTDDIPKLIQRVNQIDKGLVQEDEFIYLINWANNCKLIHKLDQVQLPNNSKDNYIIPDILVEFETETDTKKYLIEIKTSKKDKLSWTEKYYTGLKSYSELLHIPILIAWKWDRFGIWSLFEISHFNKPNINYKINFEKAMSESLMSKYFRDYMINPFEDFALNIRMKKLKKISEKKLSNGEIRVGWTTVVDSVYYTGKKGKKIDVTNKELFFLFLAMETNEEVHDSDSHILTTYKPLPQSKFAQQVPITLKRILNDEPVNWIKAARENDYIVDYQRFVESLQREFDSTIHSIYFFKPVSEK